MNETFVIKEKKNSDSEIILNSYTEKVIGLKGKNRGFLGFGTRKHFVNIYISDEVKDGEIFISKKLIDYLHLPQYPQYEIRITGNEIIIGPFIGILAFKESNKLTVKKLRKMLIYTIEYSTLKGAIVVFALDGIDTQNKLVKGYCYNPEAELWQHGVFPYPSSIYRRIGLSEPWKNHFLTEIGDRLFNNYYFNKWEMYKWLSRNELLSKSLPCTIVYESYKDILKMLESYRKVLVKPISGMQGKGIFLISQEDSRFTFCFRQDNENREVVLDNLKDAIEFIKKAFKDKKYIVQQRIKLIKCEDSIADFRIIMQKNENNIWLCNGMICRIGERKSIVSNISSNGTAITIHEFLRNMLLLSEREVFWIKENLTSFAIRVCKALDKCGVNCGTAGVDVGIDENNHIWLIEINTRDPDPTIALDIKDRTMYLKIKSAPLFYGKWLAGFGSKGGVEDVL